MFRTACDNSVTTSPPASPPTANLSISKCPPANPICTKPDRANPLHCPTTARQRLIATHHDTFLDIPQNRGGMHYEPPDPLVTPRRRENGVGLPADADYRLGCEPVYESGAGASTWKGHALLLRARRSEFRFPTEAPGQPALGECRMRWRTNELSKEPEEISTRSTSR